MKEWINTVTSDEFKREFFNHPARVVNCLHLINLKKKTGKVEVDFFNGCCGAIILRTQWSIKRYIIVI